MFASGLRKVASVTPSFQRSFSSSLAEHRLNIAKALVKAEEGKAFTALIDQPIEVLQGIGPKHAQHLQALKVHTVHDLATYSFFHLARSLVVMADLEEENGRLSNAMMNVNQGVDKAYETHSFQEMIKLPPDALQGLTPAATETWRHLGVTSIQDLAQYKYCKWAEAIQVAARYEEQ